MTLYRIFLFLVIVCFSTNAIAQKEIPLLERSVTVNLSAERLDAVLKKISDQAGFTFSYNPSIVETSKIVSYNFTKKTIREILDQIFNGSIEYKIRSNHIILTKAKETSNQIDENIFSGYVIDEATGERLRNVSVYDPVTLTSTVTDAYGYFQIKIDKPEANLKLSVNKQNYTDTLIAIPSGNRRLLNIPIHIDKVKFVTVADSLGQKIKRFWQKTIRNPQRANVLNITDTIYRKAQFSIVPFLGTNHLLSGNVINDYSLNLLGGYSLGIKKMELGGILNITRGDVDGGQVAGIFNMVGGKSNDLQMAGIFNANYGITKGAQFAGIININWNSSEQFSAAGLINFTRLRSQGVHLAGLGNFTIGEQRGAHTAGLFNFSTQDSGPLQLAGLFNFTARNFKGAQISGLLNFTGKNVRGTQVGGLLNFAGKRVTGTQVSGLLNYASKVNGSQIGLINIADSIRGVPIGLFSFVMKGYHKLEFSADEIFYTNVAFRTGVRQFYNIFTAGAKPETFRGQQTHWTFGYGIGTASKLSRKLYLNIDLTSNHIMDQRKIEALNLLNKVYVGFDVQAARHLSFTFGATLNGYVTDTTYDKYLPLFSDYQPNIIANKTYNNDLNLKMWWGAKVGIRFL